MKQIRRICLFLFLILFLTGLIFCPGVFAAESGLGNGTGFDFSYDIASMIQTNPDFSTYPGADGVIWLKRVGYAFAPGGGVERNCLWIILGRTGLDPRWLSWNIPAPEGGTVEVMEASAYAPGSGEKIALTPALSGEKSTMRSVVFSGLPEEFILVLSYKEIFPEKLSVEGRVWTSESLPVWESDVHVTVPAGHTLRYVSEPETTPSVRMEDQRTIYNWRIINAEADDPLSLRDIRRGCVAFAAKEGREAASLLFRRLEAAPVPEAPEKWSKGKLDARNADAFLQWLYDQPSILLAGDAARKIPHEAPWTSREKTLLAWHWLRDAGADVRIFWRAAYPPDGPVCEDAMSFPVLAVWTSEDDVFYCDMEDAPRAGGSSHTLWGRTLYGLTQSGRLEERRIQAPDASANRLSAAFDLRLDESGVLTGGFNVTARGAWRRFFPSRPVSDDLAALVKALFPQNLRCGELRLEESRGSEVTLTAALAPVQTIRGTGGGNILAATPPLLPVWLKSLVAGNALDSYSSKFPFTMEARFSIKLPASASNVPLPAPVTRNAGKIRYSESRRLDKRKVLTTEARLTAGTTEFEADTAAALNAALQSWQNFMTRYQPVQLELK